jgi:hypothetical protein
MKCRHVASLDIAQEEVQGAVHREVRATGLLQPKIRQTVTCYLEFRILLSVGQEKNRSKQKMTEP